MAHSNGKHSKMSLSPEGGPSSMRTVLESTCRAQVALPHGGRDHLLRLGTTSGDSAGLPQIASGLCSGIGGATIASGETAYP